MSDNYLYTELSRKRQLRLAARTVLRVIFSIALLLALYYLLPFNRGFDISVAASLLIGIAVIIGVSAWQVRSITHSRYPVLRAAEALGVAVPLFLVIFATAYYTLARSTPTTFSTPMDRTAALYFTITTFATVGFGDIVATSDTTRIIVSVQMILDLAMLGIGLKVIVSATQIGRRRLQANQDSAGDS